MRLLATSVLLVLLVTVAAAGELSFKTEAISVNGLVGTMGVAGGVFWPVVQLTDYGTELGPTFVIGENTAAGGLGLSLPVSIDAPVLRNLDFGWIGYGYNWADKAWGLEGGIGVVISLK